MTPNRQLDEFLKPYQTEVQQLAFHIRSLITELVPEANELIWDNYNAVAMAYSKSFKLKDAFCHIAVYPKHVNLGFNRGTELLSPKIKLEGKGKLIRHVKVRNLDLFPLEHFRNLILQATQHADTLNPLLTEKLSGGESIVMSISEQKIRPRSDRRN